MVPIGVADKKRAKNLSVMSNVKLLSHAGRPHEHKRKDSSFIK